MQFLRSRTNLESNKCDTKQIFPDTARQPQAPAHIKEQTDGRISQTILRIQSNQAKREIFPGLSVRHLDRFDAPGLEKYCLDGRTYRLYKQFMVTKIMVKIRKRPDCTTTFRRTIVPADDITLRCNHSSGHVNEAWGAARH